MEYKLSIKVVKVRKVIYKSGKLSTNVSIQVVKSKMSKRRR